MLAYHTRPTLSSATFVVRAAIDIHCHEEDVPFVCAKLLVILLVTCHCVFSEARLRFVNICCRLSSFVRLITSASRGHLRRRRGKRSGNDSYRFAWYGHGEEVRPAHKPHNFGSMKVLDSSPVMTNGCHGP
jgi:hypothetical protein